MKKILLICLCFSFFSQAVDATENEREDSADKNKSIATLLGENDSSATSSPNPSEQCQKLLADRKKDRAAYRELLEICLKGTSEEAKLECKKVLKNWLSDKSSSKKKDSKKEKVIPAYKKLLSLWLGQKDNDHQEKIYEELLLNWLQIKETLEIAYEVLLEKWLDEKDSAMKELYEWELRTLAKNGEPTVEDLLNKGKQDVENIIKSVMQILYRQNQN